VQKIDIIKKFVENLYENGGDIHVDVHSSRPKINVNGASARIIGVYKNLFTVEALENEMKKIYTVQYSDILIGKVKIRELEKQLL
jgi:uncharacterized protein Veg